MNRARADAYLLGALEAAMALLCAMGLYRAMVVLFAPVALDPNEGWNAYHAMAAMSGAPLYPGAGSFFFNNYPPLSFYVVGALGTLVGDNIFAGRLISLASFAFVAAAVGFVARGSGSRPLFALFGALYFAAVLLLFSDYVGMDDPQLLGHALQMGGLLLIFPSSTTRRLVLAALLFAASFFVKHNLVVLPLASLVWLAIEDRKAAMTLAGAGAGFALAGLVLFCLVLGSDLLGHLASARVWSFANLETSLHATSYWGLLPLAAVLTTAWLSRGDRYLLFCAIYAIAALAAGFIFGGGAGVDANVFFDLALALSLGFPAFLERLAARAPLAPSLSCMLTALPLLLFLRASIDSDWFARDFWAHPLHDETQDARADIAFLRTPKGPALCETLSLCYWAGKPEEVDVFNLGQAYAMHARSDGALVDKVARKTYAVIEFETLAPFALTPAIRAALDRSYRLDHQNGDGFFFVPRS